MEKSLLACDTTSSSFRSLAGDVLEQCISLGKMSANERVVIDPPTLARTVMEAGGKATADIVRLIYSLPDRMYGGSASLLGAACGFGAQELELMTGYTTGQADLARSDAYLTDAGWKFTEINIGSSIGGYQIDWAYRELDQGLFNTLSEHPQRIDTSAIWSKMVGRKARECRSSQVPSVAIVDTRKHHERFAVWNEGMARELREREGLAALACPIESLQVESDGVYAECGRVDLIYRLFGVSAIISDVSAYRPLLDAVKSGLVKMIAPLDSRFYGNKGVLALLCDPEHRHLFTAAEAALIDRHIPPTRILSAKSLGFAALEQERLVVKPVDGQGGSGVIFGSDFSKGDWVETLLDLISSGRMHVVQEQIFPSRGERLVWSRSLGFKRAEFSHLYGIFVIDSQFAGINLRATPVEGTKIVQYSDGSYTSPVYPR